MSVISIGKAVVLFLKLKSKARYSCLVSFLKQ